VAVDINTILSDHADRTGPDDRPGKMDPARRAAMDGGEAGSRCRAEMVWGEAGEEKKKPLRRLGGQGVGAVMGRCIFYFFPANKTFIFFFVVKASITSKITF
jgi:hypothetical protein